MAQDLFIDSLVAKHTKRDVIKNPDYEVWKLFFILLICSAIILFVFGRRGALSSDAVLQFYIGEIILLVSLLGSSLDAFIRSLIPGENLNRVLKRTFAILVGWIGYLFAGFVMDLTPDLPLEGSACISIISVGAVFPILLLHRVARKGFVLRGDISGVLLALSAGLVGVLGVEAHCKWESISHHLVFHLVPLLVIAGCGLLLKIHLSPNNKI